MSNTCKNGHLKVQAANGRWRCKQCAVQHYAAHKQRVKKPICPNGCMTVCLCEEL